jgi:zinc/manganese transport system substrate-binding protein
MHRTSRRLIVAATSLLLVSALAACGRDSASPTPKAEAPASPPAAPRIKVVATFSILGDMVANVGGDRVEVTTLVGRDSDAHVYSPTPGDAKAILQAQLVFVNGLGFEGWMNKLLEAAGFTGSRVVATDGIKVIRASGHGHAHDSGKGHHHHGDVDPHAWQSPVQAQRYIENIARALARADPEHASGYQDRAARYIDQLKAIDAHARERFEAIPPDRRRLITSHDSFGYLAAEYGLRIRSPQGMSTESEVSARDLARLSRQIRQERIHALFLENVAEPRVLEQLARESGARVGGTLFSDALSAKVAAANTYLGLLRYNIDTIAAALAPAPASAQ